MLELNEAMDWVSVFASRTLAEVGALVDERDLGREKRIRRVFYELGGALLDTAQKQPLYSSALPGQESRRAIARCCRSGV
jgi:hypothetical protein